MKGLRAFLLVAAAALHSPAALADAGAMLSELGSELVYGDPKIERFVPETWTDRRVCMAHAHATLPGTACVRLEFRADLRGLANLHMNADRSWYSLKTPHGALLDAADAARPENSNRTGAGVTIELRYAPDRCGDDAAQATYRIEAANFLSGDVQLALSQTRSGCAGSLALSEPARKIFEDSLTDALRANGFDQVLCDTLLGVRARQHEKGC